MPVILETTYAAALVTYRSIPPAMVIVTGFLHYVDRDCQSFSVQLRQHIDGGKREDGFTILAETKTSAAWADFEARAPRSNGSVSFSAKLLSFSQGVARVVPGNVTFVNAVTESDSTDTQQIREIKQSSKPRRKHARKN